MPEKDVSDAQMIILDRQEGLKSVVRPSDKTMAKGTLCACHHNVECHACYKAAQSPAEMVWLAQLCSAPSKGV